MQQRPVEILNRSCKSKNRLRQRDSGGGGCRFGKGYQRWLLGTLVCVACVNKLFVNNSRMTHDLVSVLVPLLRSGERRQRNL